MKISELIRTLNSIKKEYGDKEVLLSCDPEGNNYWTLEQYGLIGIANSTHGFESGNGEIIIYPSAVAEIQ